MNKYLLSIGEVSAITGVHISSLRYYDKIGILKPAYVDPFTNYRYYSFSQTEIVYAIQACVSLDIPLKEYHNFTDSDNENINAEKLLNYAMIKANEKLKKIKSEIKEIKHYQSDIERSKKIINASEPIPFTASEKHYYVRKINKNSNDTEYRSLDKLPHIVETHGYKLGDDFGFLYFYGENSIERYQFVEVELQKKPKSENIITIPKGTYYAKLATPDKIKSAHIEFKELFDKNKSRTVVLTELLTESIDVNNIMYELRCYL